MIWKRECELARIYHLLLVEMRFIRFVERSREFGVFHTRVNYGSSAFAVRSTRYFANVIIIIVHIHHIIAARTDHVRFIAPWRGVIGK